MKGQQEILTTILLVGIILIIVFAAYLWGRPLIQKSFDRSKINTLIEQAKSIDQTILSAAESGTVKTVDISLKDTTLSIKNDDVVGGQGIVEIRAMTAVPVISAVEWVPLEGYKLPFKRETFSNDTIDVPNLDLGEGCPDTYNTQNATLTMYGHTYTVWVFNITNTSYCTQDVDPGYIYVCLNESSPIQCQSDCACLYDKINKDNKEYVVEYSTDGLVYIGGDYVWDKGILGIDDQSIIVAKAIITQEASDNFIRIYHTHLRDDITGKDYYINITCKDRCSVSDGKYRIKVIPLGREETSDSVINHIKIEIETR